MGVNLARKALAQGKILHDRSHKSENPPESWMDKKHGTPGNPGFGKKNVTRQLERERPQKHQATQPIVVCLFSCLLAAVVETPRAIFAPRGNRLPFSHPNDYKGGVLRDFRGGDFRSAVFWPLSARPRRQGRRNSRDDASAHVAVPQQNRAIRQGGSGQTDRVKVRVG